MSFCITLHSIEVVTAEALLITCGHVCAFPFRRLPHVLFSFVMQLQAVHLHARCASTHPEVVSKIPVSELTASPLGGTGTERMPQAAPATEVPAAPLQDVSGCLPNTSQKVGGRCAMVTHRD